MKFRSAPPDPRIVAASGTMKEGMFFLWKRL
jgi:hypothetical protein